MRKKSEGRKCTPRKLANATGELHVEETKAPVRNRRYSGKRQYQETRKLFSGQKPTASNFVLVPAVAMYACRRI